MSVAKPVLAGRRTHHASASRTGFDETGCSGGDAVGRETLVRVARSSVTSRPIQSGGSNASAAASSNSTSAILSPSSALEDVEIHSKSPIGACHRVLLPAGPRSAARARRTAPRRASSTSIRTSPVPCFTVSTCPSGQRRTRTSVPSLVIARYPCSIRCSEPASPEKLVEQELALDLHQLVCQRPPAFALSTMWSTEQIGSPTRCSARWRISGTWTSPSSASQCEHRSGGWSSGAGSSSVPACQCAPWIPRGTTCSSRQKTARRSPPARRRGSRRRPQPSRRTSRSARLTAPRLRSTAEGADGVSDTSRPWLPSR